MGSTSIEEEMLFCRLETRLETTTKTEDMHHVVTLFFDDKGVQWEKLVDICTDGASTMLGSQSGFVARIKQKSPNAVGTHRVIHREALAFKTLTAATKDKLAIAIRVVISSKQVLPTQPLEQRNGFYSRNFVVSYVCSLAVKGQYVSSCL